MGNKEQDGERFPSCLQYEETSVVQNVLCQTTSTFPCHAVIGTRPYCSPEYSPNFHKLGSTLPRCTYGTGPHVKADTFVLLQTSVKTRVPYAAKQKLLDKQEEIQEVKQLDDWKPAVNIFAAVLQGSDDKAS